MPEPTENPQSTAINVNPASDSKKNRQQEREDRMRSAKKRQTQRRILIWGGALVALGLVIWGMIRTNSNTVGQNAVLSVPVSSEDWRRGSPNAQTTVVEYGDFQCPACGSYYRILKEVEAKYSDRVGFVFRNFPLEQIHPNASLGARATEAAGKQQKFWEMHDMLFEHQTEWSEGSAEDAKTHILQYAQTLALNMQKFNTDLDSSDIVDTIKNDTTSGLASGVNATPTFFISGKKIELPTTTAAFSQLIDAALAQTP